MTRGLVVVACALALGGCVWPLAKAPPPVPVDGCAGWTASDYTEEDIDVISQKLSDWIDGHDTNGEERGCW